MPEAARVKDNHSCPQCVPIPHVGGPILPPGEQSVLIGGNPAARKDDKCQCVPCNDKIAEGEKSVLIGNQQAARKGDKTEHGGKIEEGESSVLIGDQGAAGQAIGGAMAGIALATG